MPLLAPTQAQPDQAKRAAQRNDPQLAATSVPMQCSRWGLRCRCCI